MTSQNPNTATNNYTTCVPRQSKNAHGHASAMQDAPTKANKNTVHYQLKRPWPAYQEAANGLVERVKKHEEVISDAKDMTPMERWREEAQKEGHWHGMQSFAVMPDHNLDFQSAGKQSGRTDDGVWIPRSSS